MEGDENTGEYHMLPMISTHALTWRATFELDDNPALTEISTHALTWRATNPGIGARNSHAISTHALTWRATRELMRR